MIYRANAIWGRRRADRGISNIAWQQTPSRLADGASTDQRGSDQRQRARFAGHSSSDDHDFVTRRSPLIGHDADPIHAHSRQLNHLPIIPPHRGAGSRKPSQLPKVSGSSGAAADMGSAGPLSDAHHQRPRPCPPQDEFGAGTFACAVALD